MASVLGSKGGIMSPLGSKNGIKSELNEQRRNPEVCKKKNKN